MSAKKFNETFAILDNQSWIWNMIRGRFEVEKLDYVRLPSSVPLRESWERFKKATRIVIHWESKERTGGAVIEEILDIDPQYNVGEHIIILTSNPTHEDVVYFSELGIRRIITLRNRDRDIAKASEELKHHLKPGQSANKQELAWTKVLYAIDTLPANPGADVVRKLNASIERLKPQKSISARYIDAKASVEFLNGNQSKAVVEWNRALDKNPNYFRTYNNLINYYVHTDKPKEAYSLMQKMHELNKSNISRLVRMGELQLVMEEDERAEFYFKSALDRDAYCSGALNGMAEIRFHQGDLDESRQLLSRSHLADKVASKLNKVGIHLVNKSKYEKALDHYTKAQYVLPDQDKGKLLFYNIGLCYARWGRPKMAREFLKIALIKEPKYDKAKKLLASVEKQLD